MKSVTPQSDITRAWTARMYHPLKPVAIRATAMSSITTVG